MTTIIWMPGLLAADRRVSGSMTYVTNKLTVSGKYALAIAGDMAAALVLRDWFIKGADPDNFPDVPQEEENLAELLVADKDGARIYSRFPVAETFDMPFLALGSGSMAAMGAIKMGATIQEAMSIAASCDYGTGEAIDIVNFVGDTPILSRQPILPMNLNGKLH